MPLNASLKTVRLDRKLENAIAGGHPWVYRDALPKHDLETGEWVRVEAGKAVAFGLFDAHGAIAIRVLSRLGVPDGDWVRRRVGAALALRSGLEGQDTDTYRLLYGEGDGLPGIVVDRYGRFAVAKVYSDGVRTVLPQVTKALTSELRLRGLVERAGNELTPLYGQLPPPEVTVRENGMQLLANLYEGQKTGLFLDQRDNRATVRRISAGRRVLNLFSYNGGFTVATLSGGAAHAVSVDIAAPALADARRNVELNGIPAQRHEAVQADVFDYLSGDSEPRFDLVICDPPSFAHAKKSRHAALRAYRRLNALAMARAEPGGLLATASCTAQVPPREFREVLAQAARDAGVTAQVIHEAGQPVDHPVPVHFPEGRYLKFLVLRIVEQT